MGCCIARSWWEPRQRRVSSAWHSSHERTPMKVSGGGPVAVPCPGGGSQRITAAAAADERERDEQQQAATGGGLHGARGTWRATSARTTESSLFSSWKKRTSLRGGIAPRHAVAPGAPEAEPVLVDLQRLVQHLGGLRVRQGRPGGHEVRHEPVGPLVERPALLLVGVVERPEGGRLRGRQGQRPRDQDAALGLDRLPGQLESVLRVLGRRERRGQGEDKARGEGSHGPDPVQRLRIRISVPPFSNDTSSISWLMR